MLNEVFWFVFIFHWWTRPVFLFFESTVSVILPSAGFFALFTCLRYSLSPCLGSVWFFTMTFSLLLMHPTVSWGVWVNFIYRQSYWCRTCCRDFFLIVQFTVCFSGYEFLGLWVIFLTLVHVNLLKWRLMDCSFSSFVNVTFLRSHPFWLPIIWVEIWVWYADIRVWPLKLRLSLLLMCYV